MEFVTEVLCVGLFFKIKNLELRLISILLIKIQGKPRFLATEELLPIPRSIHGHEVPYQLIKIYVT